jgi:hypothetical protein
MTSPCAVIVGNTQPWQNFFKEKEVKPDGRAMELFLVLIILLTFVLNGYAIEDIVWQRLVGFSYSPQPDSIPSVSTVASYELPTIGDCEALCENGPGCDFYSYNSQTSSCEFKFTDKIANYTTIFNGMDSGFVIGQLRFANQINAEPIVTASVEECSSLCATTPNCQFATVYAPPDTVQCLLNYFDTTASTTIGFRRNPRPLNWNPTVMGSVDVLGNTGIVCKNANLLPDGRVLCTSGPEYVRTGRNYDNIIDDPFPDPLAMDGIHEVHDGELAALLDPSTGIHTSVAENYNIYGHSIVMAEDGTLYSAGGDSRSAPSGFTTGPSGGLYPGLTRQRMFDFRTSEWTYIDRPLAAGRWIPSVIRLVNGSFMILGGFTTETSFVTNRNIEFYNPGVDSAANLLIPNNLLDSTGTPEVPKVWIIPGSGDVFMFALSNYAIISRETGEALEQPPYWTPDNGITWLPPVGPTGRRSGGYIAASCLLPLHASRNYVGEIALFGGGNADDANQTARNDVARMVITAAAPKQWTYDTDRMPYGRVSSDCTLQPNGKILITNGGRQGFSGGFNAQPKLSAAANGEIIIFAFCFV